MVRFMLGRWRRMIALWVTFLWPTAVLAAETWPLRAPVAGHVRDLHQTWLRAGERAVAAVPQVERLARRLHRPVVENGTILLELLAFDAVAARKWTHVAGMQRWQVEAAGTTAWLVRVPLANLPQLATLQGLEFARLPLPVRRATGPLQSVGATHSLATARQCQGVTGVGVHIAVLDDDWHGLTGAVQAGEIATDLAGKAPYQSNDPQAYHGTACAEVIADMAPGAIIHPQPAPTLAELQVAVNKLQAAGVQVLSMSAGWSSGYSFGDGTGKACDLVSKAKSAGFAWVNAAGNEAAGVIWRGTWQDQNQDGWLEFAGKSPTNGFWAHGGDEVEIALDWDAYPHTAMDLDLYVCGSKTLPCTLLAKSTDIQDGAQYPTEQLVFSVPADGKYYVAVKAKQALSEAVAVRLVMLDGYPLDYAVTEGTLVDPATCKDAVAVGAIDVVDWSTGAVADYSSRGPTWDGRIKPEIAAPAGVVTSVDPQFDGTSAACPHLAGAIALRMEANQVDAWTAVQQLLQEAEPVGDVVPNSLTGFGKLRVAGPAVACLPETSPADVCTDACGQAGVAHCAPGCAAVECQAAAPCNPDVSDASADDANHSAVSDAAVTDKDTGAAVDVGGAAPAVASGGCAASRVGYAAWPALLFCAWLYSVSLSRAWLSRAWLAWLVRRRRATIREGTPRGGLGK